MESCFLFQRIWQTGWQEVSISPIRQWLTLKQSRSKTMLEHPRKRGKICMKTVMFPKSRTIIHHQNAWSFVTFVLLRSQDQKRMRVFAPKKFLWKLVWSTNACIQRGHNNRFLPSLSPYKLKKNIHRYMSHEPLPLRVNRLKTYSFASSASHNKL